MKIEYRKLTFVIEAVDPIVLPDYKGSTLRGGFGVAFKRVVCALRQKECRECLLRTSCIYAYIFETSPAADAAIMNMRKYEAVPHPFIIEPPMETGRVYRPGDRLTFGLTLVGKAKDHIPYFVYTFHELGKSGIGRGRGRFSLVEVLQNDRTVYTAQDQVITATDREEIVIPDEQDFSATGDRSVTLGFLTPVRIAHQRDLVVDCRFHILMRSLLRRICLLSYFHGDGRPPSWDHKRIIGEAEKVETADNALRWHDWERYSTRQGVSMKMGGLVGEIRFSGNLGPFVPFLKAGEVLHIGKGTSFGLGRYVVAEE